MAIEDSVKLWIYREALRALGLRRLSSLTEDREPRRVMDDAWGANDEAVELALQSADWNFATRAVKLAYDPAIEPEWGYSRVFTKPTDMVRLTVLAADEFFNAPLTHEQYSDEAGYWLSEYDTLYAKIVSKDTSYGFDSSNWTISFKKYLAGYQAFECCERLTNSKDKLSIADTMMKRGLAGAKSRDAMDEGSKRPPPGSWVRARHGGVTDLSLKAR